MDQVGYVLPIKTDYRMCKKEYCVSCRKYYLELFTSDQEDTRENIIFFKNQEIPHEMLKCLLIYHLEYWARSQIEAKIIALVSQHMVDKPPRNTNTNGMNQKEGPTHFKVHSTTFHPRRFHMLINENYKQSMPEQSFYLF